MVSIALCCKDFMSIIKLINMRGYPSKSSKLQYEPPHDKTDKMAARPAKTQISLGILHANSEDSDQTGRMPRLIWVFAGQTVTSLVLSCRGSY